MIVSKIGRFFSWLDKFCMTNKSRCLNYCLNSTSVIYIYDIVSACKNIANIIARYFNIYIRGRLSKHRNF